MTSRKFRERLWRQMRWSWIALLIALPVILIINVVSAYSAGQPIPWLDVLGGIGIGLWASLIMWLSRRWFNFMDRIENHRQGDS